MRARRLAAALLAVLVCLLPVRAEEEMPGGGGLWPGGGFWPNEDEEEEELPGGWEELPGGGIIWPGGPPELGGDPDPDTDPEPPVDPSVWADGTVENSRELCAWMQSLGPEGGKISLGATVTLTWEDGVYFNAMLEKPAIIDTKEYSLVYAGNGVRPVGQKAEMFQIEGEGVDAPVLELQGDRFEGASDWNEYLVYQEVTAYGRDGMGGVAVRVTSDSVDRSSLEYYKARGRIHASGAGAVGLKLDVPALVNCVDIDVNGEGALGIDGPEGSKAFLCKLSAGEGGRPAGDGVDTDGSILDSETTGPRIDCRVGIEPQIPQGASRGDVKSIMGLGYTQRYRLTDGSYIDVELKPEEDFAETIDTSVLGPVDIPVALPEYLQGLGLEGENGLTFRAWVRDPALPILADMEQEGDIVTFFASYYFKDDESVWDPETRLWRSDDGGETWTDATETVAWCVEDYSVELFALDAAGLDHPIFLVLENRAGWGNVVTLTPGEEGVVDPGTGGDRDGGDREEQPGGDGGTQGGNGGSGGHTGGGAAPTPRPTATPEPTPTPTPVPMPVPTPTPVPTPMITPAATPEPETLLAVQLEASPSPAPEPDAPPETKEPAASAPVAAEPVRTPEHVKVVGGAAATPAPEPPTPAPGPSVPAMAAAPSAMPAPSAAPASTPESPDETTQPLEAETPGAGGLVLPAGVLLGAGGLTALFTLWKKRGGR